MAQTAGGERFTIDWRSWAARAVFEIALIVLGILGALAVSEWRDARDRQARVEMVMAAVRAEIQSNQKLLGDAIAYNGTVINTLRDLDRAGQATVPPSAHPRGLMIRPQLVSAAWESAKAGGVLNELPVDTMLALGLAYENQQDYLDATARMFDSLYAAAFQTRSFSLPNPGLLAGLLNDFYGRGIKLSNRYKETLETLKARSG